MRAAPTNTAPGSAGQNGALGERWELVTADDGHMFIATAGDIVCHQDPNHAAGDEWDARNFRLIAAAPQMLEALNLMVRHAHETRGQAVVDAYARARAAIAAATGEAV